MNNKKLKGLIISDSNMDNFCNYLDNDNSFPLVQTNTTPFGQVIQTMIDKNPEIWENDLDFVVVWTSPENTIESFPEVINYKQIPLGKILEEVDTFSSLLMTIKDRAKTIFIPTWVCPTYNHGFGCLDMKHMTGIANILMHMNLRLAENLNKLSNIYLLNTQKWIETIGERAFKPKLWYMGKIPFGNDVFKEAVKDIKSALIGISGNARKLIILDLDDTLWGGIVGDQGWQNLNLGGHDPIGEAFVDFQKALKALTNRGVLLAIVSKNEETVALEAINNNREMILKLDDFAGWKINWSDKPLNIVELVSELNLGLQSVVFIDDNPIERTRVSDALPEVFVPEWPTNKMLYKKALLGLRCFDSPSISGEDLKRTKMYVEEKKRENLKKEIGSIDEWLKTLNMRVKVMGINESNKQRSIQLFNKTNQINLTTRRMSEAELLSWLNKDNRKLWTFNVTDKFGDSGLTGIISLDVEDDSKGRIDDFILSCRVMGRKVEEAMLYTVIKYAQKIGLKEIYAQYLPTPKNKPCLNFWKTRSGFDYCQDSGIFEWNVEKNYNLPESIRLENTEQ